MMREHVDLSEKEKLEQLHAMVVNSSWLDDDKPCEEFKKLLSSLPVETVIVFPRTSQNSSEASSMSKSVIFTQYSLIPKVSATCIEKRGFPVRTLLQVILRSKSKQKQSRDQKYHLV